MKKTTLLCMLLALNVTSYDAQTKNVGTPVSASSKLNWVKNGYELPVFDNAFLFEKYKNEAKTNGTKLMQYGEAHDVAINFFDAATKQVLPNGNSIYQFKIHSSNAVSLNVIFSKFKLATGTLMYIYNNDHSKYIGAYTSLNNSVSNELGTELLYDQSIYIVVEEPAENAGKSELEVGRIIHGFIHLDNYLEKGLNDSGDCEIDVNCPQGSGWELQRNGVVMLVNGSGGFCTGSMVNNTAGTNTPYLLTANHCGNNPGSWIFRFRWESPADQADCGTNANSVNGPETMNINGGITRANYAPSDFHLIELNSIPDQTWDVVYNGWDRSGIAPNSGACIHHPAGDIKKISLSSSPYVAEQYTGNNIDHWHVFWSDGVTEGGSSGSPLFNPFRRIVGQLHGGSSFCGGSDLSDFYGMFSVSWTGGGNNNNRLSNWLDPQNTGVEFVDANVTNSLDPFFTTQVVGLQGTLCTDVVNPYIVLTNGGSNVLTTADINYAIDGVNNTLTWSGNIGLFESDTIYLPISNLTAGSHTIVVTVTNPNNGQTDENLTNNQQENTFNVVLNGNMIDLQLNLDCYGNETSWEIKDVNNTILYSGGNYQSTNNGYTVNQSLCLNTGCYDLIIYDSWGDGMSSTDCPSGSIYMILGGDTLMSLPESEAAFGDNITKNFCTNPDTSSLNEIVNDGISIYPNPFNQFLNIQANDEILSLQVLDVTGKIVVENEHVNKNTEQIHLQVEKGSYFLILTFKKETIIKKVTK